MPNKRLTMRHIKEILRLKLEAKLSHRKISRCLNVSVGTVSTYGKRAVDIGLTWPLPTEISDNDLEQLLTPSPKPSGRYGRVTPDCSAIHQELKQKGVTKQLLWEEYKQAHGNAGYQFSQYCGYYRDWQAKQKRSMRHVHKAGEKLFVDYSGATMPIVNPDTGDIRFAEIFVAILGASNYTFAMASWTQRKADWIDAHVKAFEFFGGVPEIIVPDQLRSAVSKPCRYEPEINTSYQHMASHYKTAIIPARPIKPKDKAKAENAENDFIRAVEIGNYGEMYNAYLISLYSSKEPRKALEIANREIANRSTPETYHLLALAQLQNGMSKEALRTIETYVEGKTSEPMALFHSALVYKANNRTEKVKSLKAELKEANYELGPLIQKKIEAL